MWWCGGGFFHSSEDVQYALFLAAVAVAELSGHGDRQAVEGLERGQQLPEGGGQSLGLTPEGEGPGYDDPVIARTLEVRASYINSGGAQDAVSIRLVGFMVSFTRPSLL